MQASPACLTQHGRSQQNYVLDWPAFNEGLSESEWSERVQDSAKEGARYTLFMPRLSHLSTVHEAFRPCVALVNGCLLDEWQTVHPCTVREPLQVLRYFGLCSLSRALAANWHF